MQKTIDDILKSDFKFDEAAINRKNTFRYVLGNPDYNELRRRVEKENLLRALVAFGLNYESGVSGVKSEIDELIAIKRAILEKPKAFMQCRDKYNKLVLKVRNSYGIDVNANGGALAHVCKTAIPLTGLVLEHLSKMIAVAQTLSEPTDFVFSECASVLKASGEILEQIKALVERVLDGRSEKAVSYATQILHDLAVWSNVRVTSMLNSAHRVNGKTIWNGDAKSPLTILEETKKVAEQWQEDVAGILKRKPGNLAEVPALENTRYQVLSFAQ